MSRSSIVVLAGLWLLAAPDALAAEGELPPGVQALDELRNGVKPKNAVQNRFFLKSKRFEITPMVGLQAGNSFASRYMLPALTLGYHFTEQLMLEAYVAYQPDLGKGDVSTLVPLLIQQAENTSGFRQPFEKTTLDAALGVRWSPVYGKINILGETVANFDFYTTLGIGFVLQNQYYAVKNEQYQDGQPASSFYDLVPDGSQPLIAPHVGIGANFFLSQTIALRVDGRFSLIVDDIPIYDPDEAESLAGQKRLVTEFNTSLGVAFFFPKMKPRLFDF